MKNLKNLSRRALSLLLSLVMCLGLVNLPALAADEVTTPEDPEYKPACQHGNYTYKENGCEGEDGHVKSCTDCGEYTKEPHTYVDGKCEYCGHDMPKPEHKHELEFHKGYDATCTEPGSRDYYCCSDPSCGETFLDGEGKTEAMKEDLTIPALGHDFSEYEKNDEKTHTYKCNRCFETRDYDHVLSRHTILKQPTCTEPGLEEFVCKDENCNWTSKNEVPALGHDLMYCPGKDATCIEAGTKKSWVCNRVVDGEVCNAHFADENGTILVNNKEDLTIPTLDADYSGQKWEPCTDTQHKRVCKNCSGVADKHTEYAAHTWGEWETVKEATTTEEGQEKHACTDCGYEETRNTQKLVNPGTGNEGGNPATRYTLTIKYQYADGTEAAEQYSQEFESGASYSVPSPAVTGFSPDVTQVMGNLDSDMTVTVIYSPVVDIDNGNPPPLTETPENKDPIVSGPSETDIPDEETPATEIPEEEPPLVEIPEEEPPLVEMPTEEAPVPVEDLPDEQPPLADIPEEETTLIDIPEENVPMVGVPQTGDISLAWYAVAVLSACGLAALTLKKREGEEE